MSFVETLEGRAMFADVIGAATAAPLPAVQLPAVQMPAATKPAPTTTTTSTTVLLPYLQPAGTWPCCGG